METVDAAASRSQFVLRAGNFLAGNGEDIEEADGDNKIQRRLFCLLWTMH